MEKKANEDSPSMGVLYELNIGDSTSFASSITDALSYAESEIQMFNETIDSVKGLRPDCDKLDYALAACSGALCYVIDIFLVGKPKESPIGNLTDKWFADRTVDFAKLCGWESKDGDTVSSAISFLEKRFKVPYDQRGAGDAASFIFDLNPINHHFKSLAHNPTLLGLFFSILDQFTNSSHFVTDGELISLVDAEVTFELRGNNIPAKLFCAFVNWFGHLISDMSGSSGRKGRGMGIPSPFWAWTNDIIAIKRKLNIETSEFDRNLNELAINIYKQGFDIRFQTAQLIPVFINEIIVRLIYSIRRSVRYFSGIKKQERSFKSLWEQCEPFSNPTVKRMLTVAHGTFCVLDIGDAVIRGFVTGGGNFNAAEFAMRLNIIGVGRFTISLYGEAKRAAGIRRAEQDAAFAEREKRIVYYYIDGLKELSVIYDDSGLLDFVEDLKNSNMYIQAFQKSVRLAEMRGVLEEKILRSKSDIDSYFRGGKG